MLSLALAGCSIFKAAKDVSKAAEKVEQSAKGKGPQKPQPEEQSHEGPLLDNKVTAMRVEEALKKAGPEFQHVEVKGTTEAVVMTGTVKTAADRARAEEIARKEHRSMKLKNELKVAQ